MNLQQSIEKIQQLGTNGINYDITTEDIIEKLQKWTKKCQFTLTEITPDTLVIKFQSLPTDLETFCQEIYQFCPDVIDQGYDCIPDMIEIAEQTGKPISEDIQWLITDADLESETLGLELMKKDLHRKMQITLWWD